MKPQIILSLGNIRAPAGAIVVDHFNQCFWRDGERHNHHYGWLCPQRGVKFQIFSQLILHAPGVVTWQELIEHCYGGRADGGPEGAQKSLFVIMFQQQALAEWLGGRTINHKRVGMRFEFHADALRRVA